MPSADSTTESQPALTLPLGKMRGIGPRILSKLEKLGLQTVEDALYHLPLRYEDRRQLKPISRLRAGQQEVFVGRVLAAGESTGARSRRTMYQVIVADDSGQITLKWFRYRKAWLQKRFPIGQQAVFIGEVKQFGATREVYHPDAELLPEGTDPRTFLEKDPLSFGRILPVYPLTEG
ncbi:MAG: DNA helicase RecG, partial [Deltaproteobacteria bacterium]|nr:DNA helicase RecG [Deltaproteobacteria bacterium]